MTSNTIQYYYNLNNSSFANIYLGNKYNPEKDLLIGFINIIYYGTFAKIEYEISFLQSIPNSYNKIYKGLKFFYIPLNSIKTSLQSISCIAINAGTSKDFDILVKEDIDDNQKIVYGTITYTAS